MAMEGIPVKALHRYTSEYTRDLRFKFLGSFRSAYGLGCAPVATGAVSSRADNSSLAVCQEPLNTPKGSQSCDMLTPLRPMCILHGGMGTQSHTARSFKLQP